MMTEIVTSSQQSNETLHSVMGMNERSSWCSRNQEGLDPNKLFDVSRDTQEYATITALFHATLPNLSLDTVLRVENGAQHELYSVHKSNIRKELGSRFDEARMVRLLFHGTSEQAIDNIINSDDAGLLPMLSATTTGAIYGDGTYFARDAVYSMDYACNLPSGQRKMLVAKVVVGLWTKGHQGMKSMPLLPGEQFRKYHALVNDEANPSIFVVQHSSQAYPAYLLVFH